MMNKKTKSKFDNFVSLPTYKKIELLLYTIEELINVGFWGADGEATYEISIYGVTITKSDKQVVFLDSEQLDIIYASKIIVNEKVIKDEFST